MNPLEGERRENFQEASYENPRTEFSFFTTEEERETLQFLSVGEIKEVIKRQDDLEGEIYHELWRTGRYGDIGIIANSRIYEEGRNKIEMLSKLAVDFYSRFQIVLKWESAVNYAIFLSEFFTIFINAGSNRIYDFPLSKAEGEFLSTIVREIMSNDILSLYLYSGNPFDDRIILPDIFKMRNISKGK